MIYKASKSSFSFAIVLLTVCVLLPALAVPIVFSPWQVMVTVGTVIVVLEILMIWALVDTRFWIDEEKMAYRSGILKGKVLLKDIRRVEYSNTWNKPSLWKIGFDMKGLIVYYNKFDDIYIAPQNRDAFMDELKSRNPEIEIVKN